MLTTFTINNTNIELIEYLNDLWRYRVNDSTWTWISGSNDTQIDYGESTFNHPKARYDAIGLYDSVSKEFWLFGGYVFDRNINDVALGRGT